MRSADCLSPANILHTAIHTDCGLCKTALAEIRALNTFVLACANWRPSPCAAPDHGGHITHFNSKHRLISRKISLMSSLVGYRWVDSVFLLTLRRPAKPCLCMALILADPNLSSILPANEPTEDILSRDEHESWQDPNGSICLLSTQSQTESCYPCRRFIL